MAMNVFSCKKVQVGEEKGSEMEETHHKGSLVPLLPRLDRLDILIKHIEKRRDVPIWNGGGRIPPFGTQSMPSGFGTEEAHGKGSLLDRLALLENRLVQLSLEMGSSSVSSSSTLHTAYSRFSSSSLPVSFHSLDGTSLSLQGDHHQHVLNNEDHRHGVERTHSHNSQGEVLVEHKETTSATKYVPIDAQEPVTTSKSRNKRRKVWRCRRLLGC